MKKIALLFSTLCLLQSAHAQITSAVPGYISYQGRALDSTGALIGSTGGPVNRTVTFRVWDSASNVGLTNLLYSEQQTVTISGGEFSVLIGQGAATLATTFGSETNKGPGGSPVVKISDLAVFGGADRYLGVTIDDGTTAVDNEITPRQQIVSSAYAFRAKYAEQLGTPGTTGSATLTALNSGYTVTGTGGSTSTSTPQLLVTADDITERLRIGVDSTGNGTGFIQSFKEGTGAQNLLLNPNGGNVGIGTTSPSAALSVTGAITATGAITGGSFSTAGTITATGNVGIGGIPAGATGGSTGGSTPSTKLTVQSDVNQLILQGNSDPNKQLRIGFDVTNNYSYLQSISNGLTYRDLILNPFGTTTGYVGIGTTSPSQKLDVNGNANVSGAITANSITTQSFTTGSFNTTGAITAASFSTAGAITLRDPNHGLAWKGTGNLFSTVNVDGPVLYGYSGGALGSKVNAAENIALRWDSNGNVGIGTTAPSQKLEVNGYSVLNGLRISGVDTANTIYQASGNIGITGPVGNSINLGNVSATPALTVLNNNVGIGTTTPGFPLTFANSLGDKISLWGQSGNSYGFGIQSGSGNSLLQIHTDNALNDITFGSGSSGAMTETMRIKGNGNVGIGTTTPTLAKLQIMGGVTRGAIASVYWGQVNTAWGPTSTVPSVSHSIYADGFITGLGFVSFSDERIKRVAGRSDGARDLATIAGIEVTDYTYIDSLAKGTNKYKKVIAQQVEKVFPQAVSKSTDVVPDIYKKATLKGGWVTLATDLKVGERVRLIGEKEEAIHEVLEVRDGAFRTAFQPTSDKVFVYGREVNDFRSVDYEAIAMLNVSATQQLKREKDAEIQALRDENVALRRDLAAKDESVQARLIALEQRLSKGGTPETVSIKTANATR